MFSNISNPLFKTYRNWQDAPMMYLSHISAYLFWRSFDGASFRVEPLSIVNGNPENRKRQRDRIVSFAQANGFVDVRGKAHITASNGVAVARSSAIATHKIENDVAASCLLIDGEIPVSSPELTFVQMSSLLEGTQLIALGNELCSRYVISQDQISQRKAITSSAKLGKFLEMNSNLRSCTKAKAACGFIVDGARSPMEWKCFMLLTLSHVKGGAKLPAPKLNSRIDLKTPIQAIDQWGYPRIINSLECDLVWEEKRLVVAEYQGKEWHSDESALLRDAVKNNRLVGQNITLFELTKDIVYDEVAFSEFCEALAKALNHRNRIRAASAYEKSRILRRAIMPTNWFEQAISKSHQARKR